MTDPLSPQESLQHYFDDLLQGEESGLAGAPTPLVAPSSTPLAAPLPTLKMRSDYADGERERQEKLQRLLRSAQPELVSTPPEEIQEWDITPTAAPAELALESAAEEVAESPLHEELEGLEWLPNGRPSWAQTRFDVLLFKVSGLTLAVPLISLGQIQPLTDELTPLFGQADWFMGLQPTPAGKIRTVNTAKFVMPERYDENFVKTARYVVSINGVPWGLAVDSVNQPIRLEPEDVKWRGERSKRPWLAGTVKEHMCALLDIPRFGQLLLDADRNWHKRAKPKRA